MPEFFNKTYILLSGGATTTPISSDYVDVFKAHQISLTYALTGTANYSGNIALYKPCPFGFNGDVPIFTTSHITTGFYSTGVLNDHLPINRIKVVYTISANSLQTGYCWAAINHSS